MDQRTCKKCGFPKPLDRFAQYKGRDGIMRARGTCWDCRDNKNRYTTEQLQEYRRDYNAGKRTEKREKDHQRRLAGKTYVDSCKDVPCADCGQRWPPEAMDFDHVRGKKSRNVAQMVSSAYKLDLIKVEIAKCEVVCACCHRIRTHRRKDNIGVQLLRPADVDPAFLLASRDRGVNPPTSLFSLHSDAGLQTDNHSIPL